MAETNEVKTKRDTVRERLQAKYPDGQFEDDEAIFGRINDDYDQMDQELSGYKEREGKFSDMFTSDPRSARLMTEWRNGGDPAVLLVKLFGKDVVDAINDPEKQEAMAEANREYMERVAKEKEYETIYARNLEQSLSELEAMQSEKGLSDEQVDQAMEWIVVIAKDAMLGKITRETIEMAVKAQNFDAAVTDAAHEGEVKGRNSKIEEKLRQKSSGDGTVQLDGKNTQPKAQPKRDLGAVERYMSDNRSVWERGNERRTPVKR